MVTRLYIDIETRSRIDLRKTGVYKYVKCPDWRILMAGWAFDDDPVQMAIGHEQVLAIPDLFHPGLTKVAHNAQFERVNFSELRLRELGTPGYLPPDDWHDTQALAGELGWPQSLEMLGKALGGEEKDSAGTRLINLFCKPNRKGGWNGPDTHPEEWLDFIAYCDQDVVTLRDIAKALGDWPTESERRVFLADQVINDRGIRIDVDLARAAVQAGVENERVQKARIRELAGNVENPGSVQQMGGWLRSEGLEVPDLRAETVQKLLDGDLTDDQREVLTLRQELALAAPKKFESALEAVLPDGRLRGTLKFFGAHTGRWAGRGTQVQNLPRHAFKTDEETELAIWELRNEFGASSDTLKRLVRALFLGPFTVVDYSSIEARVLAWLAGEEWALQAFRDGRDIYVETAERMSTPGNELSRSQGKVAVLALGYNGGVNSLRAMGAEGEDNDLKRLVVHWRRANPNITRLWQQLGDAFGDLGEVGSHLHMTESEDKLGRAVHLWLPSGRAISYHGVKWERYRVVDPHTGRPVSKEGWRYADPKNPFNHRQRIGTYGGRLAENATQAVARDIMAGALVRLEDAGFHVVAHVHDEIIVEGEHDVDEIRKIMTEVPDWAYGLPIDGEGFTCDRYRKG